MTDMVMLPLMVVWEVDLVVVARQMVILRQLFQTFLKTFLVTLWEVVTLDQTAHKEQIEALIYDTICRFL
jgi:hypothetical protein